MLVWVWKELVAIVYNHFVPNLEELIFDQKNIKYLLLNEQCKVMLKYKGKG
jgi:hypothetical protein